MEKLTTTFAPPLPARNGQAITGVPAAQWHIVKNEAKYDDYLDIMDLYESTLEDIYTSAHGSIISESYYNQYFLCVEKCIGSNRTLHVQLIIKSGRGGRRSCVINPTFYLRIECLILSVY